MAHTKLTNLEPGLAVVLYSHDLNAYGATLPAWTLVTRGLAAFGQREVVLTILRQGNARDGVPEGVLRYIPALKHLAMQGKVVDDGGVSGYRAPGPFDLGAFVGVAFMGASPIHDIDLPINALTGVFLTEGELTMATSCSVTRVLNRLGKEARYFPTPYWSDPTRRTVYNVADVERSVLSKFERARVGEAAATLRGNVMLLTLPSAFAQVLADSIESRTVFAVLPARDRSINGALVWSPNQQEAEAIFADGTAPSSLAATFVGLIPNDEPEDDIRFMEDGYVVLLSAGSAARLVAALREGSSVELRGGTQERTLMVKTLPAA